MIAYKSIEIPGDFYYRAEKFIKKLKNSLDGDGLLKMARKFFEFFWENWLEFVENWKLIDIWRIISMEPRMVRNLRPMLCEVGLKIKKDLYNIKKTLIFNQNFFVKLSFSEFLVYISWISASCPKLDTMKDTNRFLQQSFRFRGGGWDYPAFPLPAGAGFSFHLKFD